MRIFQNNVLFFHAPNTYYVDSQYCNERYRHVKNQNRKLRQNPISFMKAKFSFSWIIRHGLQFHEYNIRRHRCVLGNRLRWQLNQKAWSLQFLWYISSSLKKFQFFQRPKSELNRKCEKLICFSFIKELFSAEKYFRDVTQCINIIHQVLFLSRKRYSLKQENNLYILYFYDFLFPFSLLYFQINAGMNFGVCRFPFFWWWRYIG